MPAKSYGVRRSKAVWCTLTSRRAVHAIPGRVVPVGRASWDGSWFDWQVNVHPWWAQPERPIGNVILFPGRHGGVATPLLHWPGVLLTQMGWAVLGVDWDEEQLACEGEATHVRTCADAALSHVHSGLPVLVVAKSLGTLALPWAVENQLPGIWLTPLLRDPAVVDAVGDARQTTLLAGGTADPHWLIPTATGSGVAILELPDADHGLQLKGDWRKSLLLQVAIFDRISQVANQVLTG